MKPQMEANPITRGLKMHSVVCVSTQQVPLGVLHQEVWVRDLAQLGKKHTRHKRPIQDKESQRWLTALLVTEQVILAQEENPPTGVEPIHWLLLTTLAIADAADVVQYLRWYSYRWLIERYHYVLKSGCRVEQLQLESAARLQRALAT